MDDDYDSEEDTNINRQFNRFDFSREQNNSPSMNDGKKRHRRGKQEANGERTHQCPDCEKCYLSGPALIIHRKTKHGYITNADGGRARGRPKANDQQLEAAFRKAQSHFDYFLNNENRKKRSEYERIDNDAVKENFRTIFRELKHETFKDMENVEDYPLYQVVTNMWDVDESDLAKECFSENNAIKKDRNGVILKNCLMPPMEQIFFLYLKEMAEYTNKNYFEFIQKFIVLYREYINNNKKGIVKDDYKTEKEKTYSQLFSAEGVPESCNDFFLEFLQPKNYFGHKSEEFIDLAQHLSFWLYTRKFNYKNILSLNVFNIMKININIFHLFLYFKYLLDFLLLII